MYLTFKTIHMTFALLSFTGFLLRAYLMVIESNWLKHKAVLVLPHIIDTIFLFSGFSMAMMVNFSPFNQPWISTKVMLLMCYLFCVGQSLNRGKNKTIRVVFFFLAISTFSYIVGIALNKHPLGWFT